MRTDLVTAYLIHEWLTENIPKMAAEWSFQVDDQTKGVAQLLKNTVTNVKASLVSQHLAARFAIEDWGLKDVALLGGGTPTPLSPKPDQLLFWADRDPVVVVEAAEAGYNACQVDVTQIDDLKRLHSAVSAVAPGLVHFLPEAVIPAMLNGLAEAGFTTLVFNHVNQNVNTEGAAGAAEYKKMGADIFFRNPEDLKPHIPDTWQIKRVVSGKKAMGSLSEIRDHLDSMTDINDIYELVRV